MVVQADGMNGALSARRRLLFGQGQSRPRDGEFAHLGVEFGGEEASARGGPVLGSEFKVALALRHKVYLRARCRHPERWSRGTRNWTPAGPVRLDPTPNLSPAMQEVRFTG